MLLWPGRRKGQRGGRMRQYLFNRFSKLNLLEWMGVIVVGFVALSLLYFIFGLLLKLIGFLLPVVLLALLLYWGWRYFEKRFRA